MSATAAFLQEFEQQTKTTRRVLRARTPTDKLSWKPHPKSMSLGKLALHVAASPGWLCPSWCTQAETNFTGEKTPQPTSTEKKFSVETHDKGGVGGGEGCADPGWKDDEGIEGDVDGGRGRRRATLMAMPRGALVRGVMLNHWIHHAVSCLVYLRLIDVVGAVGLRSERRRESVRGRRVRVVRHVPPSGRPGRRRIDARGGRSRGRRHPHVHSAGVLQHLLVRANSTAVRMNKATA